jgi:hypothetical protein
MKSLNKSKELWTNMSVKEVEDSNYNAACCLNARVNASIQNSADKEKKAERTE